jgi:ABC-type glycerol-3-phosphate transport system substrate-binding protein
MNKAALKTRLNRTSVAILFLTACGNAPQSAATLTVPPDRPRVEISVWHAQNGASRKTFDAFIADFQKAYPTIVVTSDVKNNESDLLKFGFAAMATNQLPDVLIANTRTIAEFARRGVLQPLDSFIIQDKTGFSDEERSDFFPGLLDSGRFPDLKNQLYAIPFDQRAVVLYYNADLLKAAKIQALPKNWDEFGAAARATTRGETRGWVMSPTAPVYYAILLSRGGSVLNDTQTQVQLNDDAGLKTIQMIAALSRGGAAYVVDDPDRGRDDLVRGKATFWFGSTDELVLISDAMARANNNSQWGVALPPQNDSSHPVTVIYGSSIAMFHSSEERARAAWLFARWLAAPEQTARWSRATLAIPLRTSALTLVAQDAAVNPALLRLRGSFGDTIPSGRPILAIDNATQIDAAIVEMWTAVGNGMDPNGASSRAVTRIKRALGQAP